jgi:ribosomal protein S27E
MKKLTCSAAVLLAVLLTAVPAVASGDGPTICESTFEEPFTGEADDLVVEEGTVCFLEGALVHGNVVAKPGAELNIGPGTTIEGNVDAYEGSFTGSFEASIGRSYRCHDCVFEDVVFSSVGKNVEIRGADDGDFIVGSTIGGNLEIVGSAAGAFVFAVLGNTVAGNVTLRDNAGAFAIEDNSIGGQLTVSGNEILESLCTPETCPPFANGHIDRNKVGRSVEVYGNSGEPLSISDNGINGDLRCNANDPSPSGAGNSAKQKRGQCRDL